MKNRYLGSLNMTTHQYLIFLAYGSRGGVLLYLNKVIIMPRKIKKMINGTNACNMGLILGEVSKRQS
jgi:hypothetical protein